MSDQTRREAERRHRERHSQRMKRAREKIDAALAGLDFEASYLLSDGDYLHPHVECSRCRAVIKVAGMAPFEHWATHHRLRAGVMRWLQQRVAREQARTSDHQPQSARFTLSEGHAEVPDAFRDIVGDKGVDRLNQPGRPLHD